MSTTTPKCKKCGGAVHPTRGCLLCPMFASGEAPTCVSDTTRFTGDQMGGRQFANPAVRRKYLAQAKKAGVNTDGKVYFSSLAAFPGDPRAWADSKGEQVRLLEERGWSADGDVKVKGKEYVPTPAVRLADDLVEERMERELEQRYPDATGGKTVRIKKKELAELRESIIEKHGAPRPGATPQFKIGPPPPGKPKGKRPARKK